MKKPELKMPSVLGKVSAKFVKKPMFNQPVHTEKRYHVTRMVYAVLLSLLVLIAASTIGLNAVTVNFIEDNRDTGFEFETEDPNDAVILAALPRMLYTAPAKLALVAGAISIFVGATHLAFVITDWKVGKKTQAYAFRRNMMFLHFGNTILILFALISTLVAHKSSSHVNVRYVTSKADRPSAADGLRYNIGTFDLETWSCEWKSIPGAEMVWMDYGAQCSVEVAGRSIMCLFLVVTTALAGLSIWGMIGRRDASGERIKTEQVELEMGKMNAI
ncbi:hypothetical protein DPSP01_009155 [Paraphaeosphaeria sporulosa]|uniref:Uncharacterized protein n=1 Tax=Paraphaeosphaeria sporulosa TaxID=1460663 RepID=A0A177CJ94_9PLEO|nr:uncharacterized protein CC84DRAFT_655767 [Paraphaeosphaeria sporulosa]OAG07386.1 hypothetical protein CC84DRAFT_655767 [Paraphaeosphaeria sporulosa]